MVVVDGHRIENGNEVIPGRRKMIIYYDSLSCNACQVSHLIDLSAIYALADSSGIFDVMTIFSPRAEEYDELMKKLVLRNFVYPVYVDYSGSFRRANRFIPKKASCTLHYKEVIMGLNSIANLTYINQASSATSALQANNMPQAQLLIHTLFH